MDKKVTYDFAWGDTPGLREILSKYVNLQKLQFNILDSGYPDENGDPRLVELVKRLLRRHFKRVYKHVIITSGATQALKVTIEALNEGKKVRTPTLSYPYLKSIASASIFNPLPSPLEVVESPSNPLGLIKTCEELNSVPIWDATYASPIFSDVDTEIYHIAAVGSLGKYLGMTGLKIGYIALSSDEAFEKISKVLQYSQAGCSKFSQDVAIYCLEELFKLDKMSEYEKEAKELLKANRKSVEGLFKGVEKLKDLNEVDMNMFKGANKQGMFYIAKADLKLLTKLDKNGIKVTDLYKCGYGEQGKFIRINLARTRDETKQLVKLLKKIL